MKTSNIIMNGKNRNHIELSFFEWTKINLSTDYGHPELFFKNLKLLGLGRQIGLKFYEAFGVFPAKL